MAKSSSFASTIQIDFGCSCYTYNEIGYLVDACPQKKKNVLLVDETKDVINVADEQRVSEDDESRE